MDFKKIIYETIDSTNLEMRRLIPSIEEGTAIISNTQTQGKGRFGRSWESEKDLGLYMSILVTPDLSVNEMPMLSIVSALAISQALASYKIESKIKWPNDIIINNKKIAGILNELYLHQGKSYLICGIGVNVNHELEDFNEELAGKASSLKIESLNHFDIGELSDRILSAFASCYMIFLEQGPSALIDKYKDQSMLLGREVYLVRSNEKKIVKVKDINARGELIVLYDGLEETITSGEVSVRGLDSYI